MAPPAHLHFPNAFIRTVWPLVRVHLTKWCSRTALDTKKSESFRFCLLTNVCVSFGNPATRIVFEHARRGALSILHLWFLLCRPVCTYVTRMRYSTLQDPSSALWGKWQDVSICCQFIFCQLNGWPSSATIDVMTVIRTHRPVSQLRAQRFCFNLK